MSEPTDGGTPPDHEVVAIRIDAALLPGWFAEIERVAARVVRRMMVIEDPAGGLVRCELRRDRKEAFVAALEDAWAAWQGRVAAA